MNKTPTRKNSHITLKEITWTPILRKQDNFLYLSIILDVLRRVSG